MNKCNLECVQPKISEGVLEFVGPVKIVLVDTPQAPYYSKVSKAAAILMAQILIGITTSPVLYYTLTYKKDDLMKALHVLLCTIGLQILIPFGILSCKTLSGSSSPMRVVWRRAEHIFLTLLGYLCLALGTCCTYVAEYSPFYTVHCCLGLAVSNITVIASVFAVLFSFFNCYVSIANLPTWRKYLYYMHRVFGALALILSSVCFITGLLKPNFANWLQFPDVIYLFIVFCVFYTVIIMIS